MFAILKLIRCLTKVPLRPDRGADYYDERVCVCVCLSVRDHIFQTTRAILTKFFVHVSYTDIAKFAGHLPHRYGNSRAIWDHTVLPATGQR